MERYHLAKLVQWSRDGELRSRKRLQKVVYLLQSAGCKTMKADFILHHYGPYSADVAEITDRMVSAGVLVEKKEPNPSHGFSYTYGLSAAGEVSLKAYESTEPGKELAQSLCRFEVKAKDLLGEELCELEYAATIVYFYKNGADWKEAVTKTSKFKQVEQGDPAMQRAIQLAESAMRGALVER